MPSTLRLVDGSTVQAELGTWFGNYVTTQDATVRLVPVANN